MSQVQLNGQGSLRRNLHNRLLVKEESDTVSLLSYHPLMNLTPFSIATAGWVVGKLNREEKPGKAYNHFTLNGSMTGFILKTELSFICGHAALSFHSTGCFNVQENTSTLSVNQLWTGGDTIDYKMIIFIFGWVVSWLVCHQYNRCLIPLSAVAPVPSFEYLWPLLALPSSPPASPLPVNYNMNTPFRYEWN